MSWSEKVANVHQWTDRLPCHEAPKICAVKGYTWKAPWLLLCKLLKDSGSPQKQRCVLWSQHSLLLTGKMFQSFILWPFKRVLNKRCTYFEGVLVVLCVQLYFLCTSISYQIHGNEKNATFFSTLTKWFKWWSSQIHTLATCNRSVCQKYVPCTSPRICPNWTFFSRPVSFAQ